MISKIKNNVNQIELSILFILFISLNLPYFHISIITLPLSLYVIFRNKSLIQVDERLINILYLFLIYLVFFSIFTIDYGLSVKGSLDILKTMIVFLSGIVFFKKIDKFKDLKVIFLLIILFYLMGNFFFFRGNHFNYYENSNSGAINVLLVFCVSLFLYEYKKVLNNILISLITVVSIFLVFYAVSRGVILSCFVSILLLALIFARKKIKIYIISISSILFLLFIFFFNHKGFGLSNREDIWIPLVNYTIDNNLFFGNGINTIKIVIKLVDSFTNIAHNIFVEIFVSSGLLGSLFIFFIFYLLFKFFMSLNYSKTLSFYVSLFNIITLCTLFLVDLKFFAYPYIGLFMLSLSALYTSKINYNKKREI